MKFLICKTCGHVDLTSSDEWKVTRPKDDAEIFCPECNGKEFLKMELSITCIDPLKNQIGITFENANAVPLNKDERK